MRGGPHYDRFSGGTGDDRIDAVDGLGEYVFCDEGIDHADVDPSDDARDCENVRECEQVGSEIVPGAFDPRCRLLPIKGYVRVEVDTD